MKKNKSTKKTSSIYPFYIFNGLIRDFLFNKKKKEYLEYERDELKSQIEDYNKNDYKLESFQLGSGRLYCFTDGFSECRNEQGEEIGIDGVKQLITSFQNSSLKKELLKITKDVEKKSTKGQNFDQSNNQTNILEDDLTIIGLGK